MGKFSGKRYTVKNLKKLTFEVVDLTKPGVQSLEGNPGGSENLALSGLGLSLIISMGGIFEGFCFDKGSLASFNKKSRPYCFLPSVLIGDHCSEN